jgi:hypothetical protein
MSALDQQPGGNHYKDKAIQPIQYIHANGLGYCEGNVVKYVTRWRDKNGLQDLLKAKHYIDLLIELERLEEPQIDPTAFVAGMHDYSVQLEVGEDFMLATKNPHKL